jgi:MoCo/4Fe-4S cofactor protein with predicted Tat translocation signal
MSMLPITSAPETQQDQASPTNTDRTQRTQGYWRSLNELDQTPEFQQFVEREFPQAASEFPSGVSRRRWLQLMSASIALGGAAGCHYGTERFAPDINRPENTIYGLPKRFATNFELAGRAVNLLITNLDGRPIKVEGNPDHPLMRSTEPNDLTDKPRLKSAGTDLYSQACILGLYDPDRASRVAKRKDDSLENSSWDDFSAYCKQQLERLKGSQGSSLAILMSPSLSPSVNRMLGEIVKSLPQSMVVQYKSVDDSAQRAAATQAAGNPAELLYDLTDAKVICCMDSDLLGNDPNMLIYSRQFAKGRTPDPAKMNRLYSVEARFSVTGSTADSRLPLRSSQIGAMLVQLDKKVDQILGGQAVSAPDDEKPYDKVDAGQQVARFVEAMADDLVKHKGAGVVSVGYQQPLDVQLLALRINQKLGNIGKTVKLIADRSTIQGVKPAGLGELAKKIGNGIDTVWILGDNPVYAAPGNLGLGDLLVKLEHVVYLAEFEDETAKVAGWSIPVAHPLESWGDVLSVDGSYGVSQPQILPLLDGKSLVEILAMFNGQTAEANALVRATATTIAGSPLNASAWHSLLHDGFLSRNATEFAAVNLEGSVPTGSIDLQFTDDKVELILCESDAIYDGRFAKNVWLQELPQAITKLCWDNAALISPATAAKFGLKQDIRQDTVKVRLAFDGQQVDLPVFLMPGQADGTIVTHLGYGRACRDEVLDSDNEAIVGHDVAKIRRLDKMHIITGVEASRTGRPYKLATTQDHFAIDKVGAEEIPARVGRLVREGTLEQITEGGKEYIEHMGIHHPDLKSLSTEPMDDIFEKDPTIPYQWGMSIDLNKCTGCNSCVIACQAENNVPVVGKDMVIRGREMHWLRIDRYFRGNEAAPQIVQQPVACAHCETAPCEQVCPVAATVHTEEGINTMAYNRCVGTRYCANNCPYKVRRFNYLNYQTEYGYFYGWQQNSKLEEAKRKLQALVLNPEVSVRGRGVMEKCTYCLQRVQNAKIQTRIEGRRIEDGELQSACQAACPTQAIVFGNIKDPQSQVSKNHADARTYDMLGDLNIKPRTKYMVRVRNTHQRLKTEDQLASAHHGHGHDNDHDHDKGRMEATEPTS